MADTFLGGIAGNLASGLGTGSIGRASVQLLLDTRAYEEGLAKSKAQTETATKSAASGFNKLKTAAIASAALAGVALLKFAGDAVQAASDENEALNKVNVIFGKSTSIVEKFASTSAKSFAISKTAAYDAAAGFGNIFDKANLSSQAAAEMSVRMVALAGDMASFNNIPVADALEKIRAGLVGQSRPLREVGVLLSETRVKQEAYREGIAAVGSDLTEGQKIQARYNLILKDSQKQQGDMARTADTLANKQRVLAASFDDLKAQIGTVFLPAAKDAVTVLQWILEHLPQITKAVVTYGLAWAAINWETIAIGALYVADSIKAVALQTIAAIPYLAEFAALLDGLSSHTDRYVNSLNAKLGVTQQDTAATNDAGDAALKSAEKQSRLAVQHAKAAEAAKAQRQEEQDLANNLNITGNVFQDFANKIHVSTQHLINDFDKQLQVLKDYGDNMATLLHRNIPKGLLDQLQQMGIQGAGVVEALATANKQQFSHIISDWRQSQHEAQNTAHGIESALHPLTKGYKIPITFDLSMPVQSIANTVSQAVGTIEQKIRQDLARHSP